MCLYDINYWFLHSIYPIFHQNIDLNLPFFILFYYFLIFF